MLTALAAVVAPPMALAAAGDIYVADQSAGPAGSGAIFRVDPATGAATPVTSGPPLSNPGDMAFDRNGTLVVADEGAAAIFRVDPVTGSTTQVARGGELADPWGVAYGPAGRLFVTDVGFGSDDAIVFRINVDAEGNAGAKMQFANGPPLIDPAGIARESENAFLVTDLNGEGNGYVHRVDAAVRGTPIEQVAVGPPLVNPWGIAIDPASKVVIADSDAFGGGGGLLDLDPNSGAVTPIASGPPYTEPVDVALVPGGSTLVADSGDERPGVPGPGALLAYDPVAGTTTSLLTGPPLVDPSSVAVEPPICRGQTATIVGSEGNDKLTGTRFPDVVAALGGNDVVKADRNNDIVCGGKGRDRVNGGMGADELGGEGGKDRLIGAEGPDVLDGGPGRDRCNGKSSHKDRAVACEKQIKVP